MDIGTLILFIVGFVILIKGADLLVDGGSSIGKRFGISELIIGLTIVSFGTSLPELLVNVYASFEGSADIAIGNILGSNIANILLILGVSAMISPLPITRQVFFSEIPFSLTATLLVGFLANAMLFYDGAETSLYLSREDGGILLFFFALFLAYVFVVARQKTSDTPIEEHNVEKQSRSLVKILIGMVGLYFGGDWVVTGAKEIAIYAGYSETFIGLTVIAIGTSLPELVTSVIAALKKNTDIAIGNAVGSNIFNMLWILGISAVIKPLPFNIISNTDILMIIFSSTMLLLAVIIGKRTVISRWEGLWFVLAYGSYMVFLILRG